MVVTWGSFKVLRFQVLNYLNQGVENFDLRFLRNNSLQKDFAKSRKSKIKKT